jgi:acyl-homoserine lactone acylase PvdQ
MKSKMKLVLGIVLMSALFIGANPIYGQKTNKEIEKEIKSKPSKTAKKQAKAYKKEGYYTSPGLTMEKLIDNLMHKQLQTNDDGTQKYIFAEAISVGETQIAAQLQAQEAAKLNLAGQIQTEVAALIEQNIANAQLNTEEANSVTELTAASKNLIAQSIGQIEPALTLYKNIDKNIEVRITIAYDKNAIKEQAKEVIRKSLKEKTDLLQDKLDTLMNF